MNVRRHLALSNLPFALKFALAPVLAVCLLGLVAAIGYAGLGRLAGEMGIVVSHNLQGGIELAAIAGRMHKINGTLFQVMTDQAAGAADAQAAQRIGALGDEIAGMVSAIDRYRQHYASPDQMPLLDKVIEELNTYKDAVAFVGSMLEIDFNSAASFIRPFEANYRRLTDMIDSMIRSTVEDSVQRAKVSTLAAQQMQTLFLGCTGLAVVLVVLVSTSVGRRTTRSIGRIAQATLRLARGDHTVDIAELQRGDELVAIVDSLDVFRRNQIELKESWERQQLEFRVREERAKTMELLASGFDSQVTSTLKSVMAAAATLQHTADNMSQVADQTVSQVTAVASASEQGSRNVQGVAAATEELSATIRDITQQVTESNRISDQAVEAARRADNLVGGLDRATSQIGEVVKLITTIAKQTNLLALNATIEAARAGTAGRGFAVVANEVKHLSRQTEEATKQISRQITAVQTATQVAISAIREITDIISQISQISGQIHSAMDQQSVTTGDIARGANEAAAGTRNVSFNISGVSEGASTTGQAARDVLEAANVLTRQSDDLRDIVDTFLQGVRTTTDSHLTL